MNKVKTQLQVTLTFDLVSEPDAPFTVEGSPAKERFSKEFTEVVQETVEKLTVSLFNGMLAQKEPGSYVKITSATGTYLPNEKEGS